MVTGVRFTFGDAADGSRTAPRVHGGYLCDSRNFVLSYGSQSTMKQHESFEVAQICGRRAPQRVQAANDAEVATATTGRARSKVRTGLLPFGGPASRDRYGPGRAPRPPRDR
jgi:hypothetical protein